MRRICGQNIIEFIIIVAVVVLGSIMALTLLGGNISEMFGRSSAEVDKFKPFGGDNPDSNSPQLPTSQSSSEMTLPSGTKMTQNPDGTFNLDIDGILIQNIPTNYYDTLQATGGSGGTMLLADLITQMANNLPAEIENIDETTQILLDMASKARQMADIEEQLQAISQEVVDFCKDQPNAQECYFDGHDESSMGNLVATLAGDDGNGGLTLDLINMANDDKYKTFAESYPAASTFIDVLRSEISAIARQVEIDDRSMHDGDGEYIRIFNAQNILTPGFENAEQITDLDSEIICQVGNGSYDSRGCK